MTRALYEHQHTIETTHAIPDGVNGGDDSSPPPRPPKPNLGPGSGPWSADNPNISTGSTEPHAAPAAVILGLIGTQGTREHLSQQVLKVCTTPVHSQLLRATRYLVHLAQHWQLASPPRQLDTLLNGWYPVFTDYDLSTRMTHWKAHVLDGRLQ